MATWGDRRPVSAIFPSDCLLGAESCQGWVVDSISGNTAVLWSEDDEAYFVPGDGPVRRFQPKTGALSIDPETPLRGLPDHVGAAGQISSRDPYWDDGVPVDEDYELIGLDSGPDGFEYAFLDRETHQVTLRARDGWRETTVSARWSDSMTPVRDAGERLFLTGAGVAHRMNGLSATPSFPNLYQPRPIIDASTGLLVGAYDDVAIMGWDPDLNASPQMRMMGIDHIESVAVSTRGGLSARRVKLLDGRSELSLNGPRGAFWTLQCPAPPRRNQAAQPPVAGIALEDWGRPGRPLMVRQRVLTGPARGTVVFWQGGPGNTFTAGGAWGQERDWLGRGFNVITVDGSGSQGIELGQRLRDEGFNSILADAEDVATRLAGSQFDNTRIVVVGQSFGGAGAAETARRLGSLTVGRRAPPELLLLAPWLRYRPPAEYNLGEGRERLNQDYLERSDVAAFGRIDTLARDIEAWRTGYQFDGRTLALFAEADLIVRQEDIWPRAAQAEAVDVRVIPRIDHRFLGAARGTTEAIEAWLASGTSPEL